MEFRIPFSGRGHNYTEAEISTVVEAMQSAVPLTQGDYLEQFESRFKEFAGTNFAFALNNATSALEITAQLCQLKPDDEVIIPSHTFTSSAYPFAKTGARIVWADIDLHTRVVTPQTIVQCLTSKTRVVVVPHLYGFGADMLGIMELAQKYNFFVVEDAAQVLGVYIDGKMAGTFGHAGVYSFHSHKNVTTLGEGGMLVVKDTQLADLIPLIRHNGHCPYPADRPDYWKPAMGNVELPELNGKTVWPSNFCLGEVESALGSKLIERVSLINKEKRDRALRMIGALSKYPELTFHVEDSSRHNYHLLVAQLSDGLRDPFIRHMASHHKIQCVVQYCPLNRYPFYRKLGFGDADCPNADLFYDNMVSFPFNHLLTDDELLAIEDATIKTLRQLR